MLPKKTSWILWLLLSLLSVAFFFIKYSSFLYIEKLYTAQKFDTLNQLTEVSSNRTLDFYLGEAEDLIFGPLQTTISVIAFLIFAFFYLKNTSALRFALAVLIYLLLSRPEVLLYPPYGDALVGPFSDTIWLIRHNLDYPGLLRQETFVTGGPQIYPTSIFPLMMAVIMKLTVTPKAFLITMHLIVFVFAAVITALLREIFLKTTSREMAILGSMALVATPLFQSMVEMINMEMTCLFFAMLSVYYLTQKRFIAASIMAVLSLAIKSPGAITCASVLFAAILIVISDTSRKRKAIMIFCGVLACLAAWTQYYVRSQMVGKQMPYNMVSRLIGWSNFQHRHLFWFFVFIFALFILWAIYWLIKTRKTPGFFRNFLNDNYIFLVMLSMVVLWIGLYLNFSVLTHRYMLLVAPFYAFCTIYVLFRIIPKEQIVYALTVFFIIINLLASHGWLYDSNHPLTSASFNFFERSLEYRNVLKLKMKLAKDLQENYSDYLIGAPFPFVLALNFTEVGYVEKKLDVMVYGMKSNHEGIHDFPGLQHIPLGKTIWVGQYQSPIIPGISYPFDESKDRFVKDIEVGDKKVFLFMGGLAIQRMRTIVELKTLGVF